MKPHPTIPGLWMDQAGDLFYRLPVTRDGAGYGMVTVPGGKGRRIRTHRLRWEIQNGQPVPPGQVVRHLDDDKANESPGNLALGSQWDNIQDARRNGQRVGSVARSAEEKAAIRARRAAGESLRTIGADYGISPQRVCDICKGR